MAYARSSPRTVARARAASAKPPLTSRWTYGYGLFNAATHSSDNLLLVYATVLGASTAMVAAIDAIGSVTSVIGLLALGKIADRIGVRGWVLGLLCGAPALVLLAFTRTDSPVALLGLGAIWGFVFIGPVTAAPVIITRLFRRDAWATEQVRLSTTQTLGTALGMAAATGWLAVTGHLWGDLQGIRGFFLVAVALCGASAVAAWVWTRSPWGRERNSSPTVGVGRPSAISMSSAASGANPMSLREVARADRPAPYNDQLKSLFVVTLLLFVGLGMAGAIMPVYLKRELEAKGYVVMAASFAFGIAVTLGLAFLGRAMSRPLSLRFYALAISGRALIFLALGALAFLLPNAQAQVAAIVLMALGGLCSAATVASSSTRLVALAPFGRKGSATGHYGALTFIALAAGALVGGVLAQYFGFFPAFALAALWLFIASALALRL